MFGGGRPLDLVPSPTNSDGALIKHSEEALGKKRPSILSW
jgi:hypothetical protein